MSARPESLKWRVAQPTGSDIWQVKQAPGWKVVFRAHYLVGCAGWLVRHGVRFDQVAVPQAGQWRTLNQVYGPTQEAALE